MPEPTDFNLTSTGSFLIGQKTAFSIAAIADLDPRRLLHQTLTLDGRVVRVLAVETPAVVNATGHPFALVVSPLMPEPDFDQIAERMVRVDSPNDVALLVADIADQLRQVWNARGAADINAKHAAFRADLGLGGALADAEDEAIKKLDR